MLLRIGRIERCVWAGRNEYGYWMATACIDGACITVSRKTLSALKARLAELQWRARTGRWPVFE